MIDWDAWRTSYDTATFADQQAFYDLVYELHPEQARFSAKALSSFLEHIGRPVSVVEFGGWDGGLAAEILTGDSLVYRWTNYEISRLVLEASICESPSYRGVALRDWYWTDEHEADLFVASHVIEHLRFEDVKRVFDVTTADWLYLQSPLSEEPTDWMGYHGSHILEVGWAATVEELKERGYALIDELTRPGVRCFGR